MRNRMKMPRTRCGGRFFAILLAAVMMLAVVCMTGTPVMAEESGKCGYGLTWTLSSDGTLTIKGRGTMDDYPSANNELGAGQPWKKYRNEIQKIVIRDTSSIGAGAFAECENLTEIEISDTVYNIGGNAFVNCRNLAKIELPNYLRSIGNGAFSGCEMLREITIPMECNTIGSYSFYGCSNLEKVNLPSFGYMEIGKGAFGMCKSLTEIEIPSGVTKLEELTFSNCSNLQKITIPNSVTSMGLEALGYCKNLQSVFIPDSVTEMEEGVFVGCTQAGMEINCEWKEQPRSWDEDWLGDCNAEVHWGKKPGGSYGIWIALAVLVIALAAVLVIVLLRKKKSAPAAPAQGPQNPPQT